MKAARLLLAAALLVLACVKSPVVVTKPEGDISTLRLRAGRTLRAELLAVDGAAVYFLHADTVWRVADADIASLRIEGYSLVGPKITALAALAAGTAVSVYLVLGLELPWVPYIVGAMPVLGAIEMFSTEPRVDFRSPFDRDTRSQLELHCRYMRCPTAGQWDELLSHYGQDDFRDAGQAAAPGPQP